MQKRISIDFSEEFSDCSVIFTDIPDFFTISVNCSPTEIITVVTDLFHRFDRIIEKHKGYKVLSLMDSYLIVGGVPNANQYHCEDSLNLALGLLFEAKQVVVPKLERSVRLRIGVHCGPVVAGIVSQQKPRYIWNWKMMNSARFQLWFDSYLKKKLGLHVRPQNTWDLGTQFY